MRAVIREFRAKGLACVLAVGLLALIAPGSALADGALDSSFGGTGKIVTPIGTDDDQGNAVAVDKQGRIVVAGVSYDVSTGNDFGLSRYKPNGSLDPLFGSGGKVTTDFARGTYGDDEAHAVAIDSQGRIVVAGEGGDYQFALARYNVDGSLDTSFGSGGGVTTPFFSDGVSDAHAVKIDGQGRIVAAGTAFDANGSLDNFFALARYNPDGSLDPSFGSGGTVTTRILGSDRATSMAIDKQGRIVVAGYTYDGIGYNFALARYNANGALDPSFSGDGTVVTSFSFYDDEANAVTIDKQGRIVAAGWSRLGNNDVFALARYKTNGSLEPSFGSGGKVMTRVRTRSDHAYGVAIDAQGRIVAAGDSWSSSGADFGLARYNADGSLDPSFSGDGKLTTSIRDTDQANGVAIDSRGRIVAAGYTSSGSDSTFQYDFALARYLGDQTAPVVTIIGPSTVKTKGNTATATFRFSASEPATFKCRVDSGALTSCQSPYTTRSLGLGTHQFTVQATDSAQNRGTKTKTIKIVHVG